MSHPWITEAVFVAGMYSIAWEHKGGFLPEPATALEFFEAAKVKVDREREHREAEQRANLPPPPAESEPPASHAWTSGSAPAAADRDAWDRNLTIGAARMRKRKDLIEKWRRQQGPAHDWHTAVPESAWKGLDEPTAVEVEAQLVAMQQKQGSPVAEAAAARQQTRRGTGRMRFEWKDGEVSEVTLSHLEDTVSLSERAAEPKNRAVLERYDDTPPYNDRDYNRDRARFEAKRAAEAKAEADARV